jgi:hypothetical protein
MNHFIFLLLVTFTQQAFSQTVQINIAENRDTLKTERIIISRSTSKIDKKKIIHYSEADTIITGSVIMINDKEDSGNDPKSIIVEGKSADVSFIGTLDNGGTDISFTDQDTIIIGNMIIINEKGATKDTIHIRGDKFRAMKDSTDFEREQSNRIIIKRENKLDNCLGKKDKTTIIWGIVDLGFTNINDLTNYASINGASGYFPSGTADDMILQNGKSVNINIWVFMQRVSLISNIVNLKYGLGIELNNYRFKKNIRFRDEPRYFIERDTEVASFEKNKLAADYISVPVMLNFNFTPGRANSYGFSAGVSAGYLYSARQKMVSKERGKEKVRNDFNLQPWKLSAIAELNLGFIQLYGSYALGNMFRSGLDQTPYSAGIRFSSPQ